MIRTILFFLWMWVLLALSLLLLIPLLVLKLLGLKKTGEKYTYRVTQAWARHLVWTSGSKITVTGLENIPENGSFCLISNHNSNFDIPLLMAHIPRKLGFISKAELAKVPFLSTWMNALGCVYIKRKSITSSITGMKQAVQAVKDRQSMVLFPEGTRSKGRGYGRFYQAGIKLALQEGIPVVPVTIKNSGKMFEFYHKIVPQDVEVVVHSGHFESADEVVKRICEALGETENDSTL